MRKEKAIELVKDIKDFYGDRSKDGYDHEFVALEEKEMEALDMAIDALQRETSTFPEKHQLSSERHGKWVKIEMKGIVNPFTGKNRTYIGCSCCGQPIPTDSVLDIIEPEEVNFCLGCGAKMNK